MDGWDGKGGEGSELLPCQRLHRTIQGILDGISSLLCVARQDACHGISCIGFGLKSAQTRPVPAITKSRAKPKPKQPKQPFTARGGGSGSAQVGREGGSDSSGGGGRSGEGRIVCPWDAESQREADEAAERAARQKQAAAKAVAASRPGWQD